MVEYRDSSSGRPEDALGNWLAVHVVPGIQAFRCQTGFFSLGALRDHLNTLRSSSVVRIVLGSNAPEQPTVEDVRALLPLMAPPARGTLTLVACGGALFHAKVIHIVDAHGSATGYVGSANMTEAGLGRNLEAGVILGPDSAQALARMAAAIDAWGTRAEDGVFQIRGEADLARLVEQGFLVTAAARRASRAASRSSEPTTRRGVTMRAPTLWRPSSAGAEPLEDAELAAVAGAAATTQSPPEAAPRVDPLRWCKELKASDAQQVRDGTNPTGKLRLAQARFATHASTYFRSEFFGSQAWASIERTGRVYEECTVRFDVTVHGASRGNQVLKIDHAAHRVADQGNVPTVLGWGRDLGAYLKEHSEVGNWVVLERRADGTFALAITDQRPEWAP